jgi:putative ABC transport system permease protein
MFWTLYGLGMWLLPPDFRRRYGASLLEEAQASMRERPTRSGRIRRGVALALDLAGAVAREWWHVLLVAVGGAGSGIVADARLALRALRRSPGYALAIIGTLGLGIGASTTAFGLADAYLLRSLPYPEPDRLMVLWPEQNWSRSMVDMARDGLPSLEELGGVGGATLVLSEGGEPEELFVSTITTNVHRIVGVAPALGRGFIPEDAAPGAEPVVILSHPLWAERFGSDPTVLGRAVALGGEGHLTRTVVGIMPAGYLPVEGKGVDAWIPVTMDRAARDWSDSYFMQSIARLGVGARPERVATDTRAWAERVREAEPGWFSEDDVARATAVTLASERTASRRMPLTVGVTAALLVLLVACANVANLVVARTTGREHELSIRAALGAGRVGTARVVLSEVLLLAGVGGLAGLGVAAALVRRIERRIPEALPDWGLSFDARWVGAAILLAGIAAVVAGAVPALQAARRDPARSLSGAHGGTAGMGMSRFQRFLSASQLALATAGIAAVALLGRSLDALSAVDVGFDREGAVTFRVTAPPTAYPEDADVTRFFRDVRSALAEVPGVESVGLVSRLPLSGGDSRTTVLPEGWERQEGAPLPEAWHRLITPGYLEALGARLWEGRLLGPEDDLDGAPELVVLNRTAADRFWPGESAVGKRFSGPGGVTWVTVAGVIGDVRERGQQGVMLPALYIPHRDWPWRTMYGVVRARGEPMRLVPALKDAVWSVSAGVPVSRVQVLDRIVSSGLLLPRLLTILAAVAGAVTLLLGALGVYGVVSHAVARRRRELGVRAALGADRSRLVRGELHQATGIVASGLAAGLALAWAAGRGLASAVSGVESLDIPAFAAAVGLLGVVAYGAAWFPARRAARVDPVRIIRDE